MTLAIVQFPHPGPEHQVGASNLFPWNTGSHRRKFLCSPGHATGVDREVTGELAFWGEWEPPSEVVERWEYAPALPSHLHRPYWTREAPPHEFQNTDPFVFGHAFRYSNCKQLTPRGRPSKLQELEPGSVILFGSAHQGDFVLDTVFVVGGRTRFVPAESSGEFDEVFESVTVRALRSKDDSREFEYTAFTGATLGNSIGGMYSFAPCRPVEDGNYRFARPAISVPGVINPASRQAPSGAGNGTSLARARQAWELVRDQVLASGCLLGYRFKNPTAR